MAEDEARERIDELLKLLDGVYKLFVRRTSVARAP